MITPVKSAVKIEEQDKLSVPSIDFTTINAQAAN